MKSKARFATLFAMMVVLSFGRAPKAEAQSVDLVTWAIRRTIPGFILDKVREGTIACAKSTTCITGQSISMVTHRVPENNMFNYYGYCFNGFQANESTFKRFTSDVSRRGSTPIIYSYYDSRNRQFVFGVPR